MPYIPKWAWYLAGGVAVIAIIYGVTEFLDAATGMLPGDESDG